MPDWPEAAIELLRPFVDAWAARDRRKAASRAGQLMFWSDGMLGTLRKIAAGDKKKETFSELKKKFVASQDQVNSTLIELAELRGKLAGSRIARKLDTILNDYQYGKSMIRSRIEAIIEFGPSSDTKRRAAEVCRDIETLNSELERLHRMVYDK